MNDFIFAIIFLLLAVGGVVIRKTYFYLPVRELKRRARQHDHVAAQLYRAVAYGSSLRAFLWLFIAIFSAISAILLARVAPVWLSLPVVVLLLWMAFSWLPASKTSSFGQRLTLLVTPAIVWLLNYLHPTLSRGADVVSKRYTAAKHTGLYEREDLLKLISNQQKQDDNRLSEEELEIAKRALNFGDHKVGDLLTSRKVIKTVLANDTVGPVLIDELHKSGQIYALARDKPKGKIVGTLRFSELSIESNGKVSDLMDPAVYYLHEDDSLTEALHAFFATNHPVFVVTNNFEEYLGIITIESILRQLLGHVPGSDFEQYADQTAVANRHTQSKEPEDPKSDPEDQAEISPPEPSDT